MNSENTKKLLEKYPEIFNLVTSPGNAPHYPISLFIFECGDGWYNIIDSACAAIQNHIDNEHRHVKFLQKWNEEIKRAHAGDWSFLYEQYKSEKERAWLEENLEKEKQKYLIELREVPELFPQVVATQVKEKYGTLRFYLSHEDDYISGIVAMAEYLSGLTCETCGAPGKTRSSGWVRTLCDKHAEEQGYSLEDEEDE